MDLQAGGQPGLHSMFWVSQEQNFFSKNHILKKERKRKTKAMEPPETDKRKDCSPWRCGVSQSVQKLGCVMKSQRPDYKCEIPLLPNKNG